MKAVLLTRRNLIFAAILLFAGLVTFTLVGPAKKADAAPVCYNDAGRRAAARNVSNVFPRDGMSVNESGCGNVAGNRWVLLSSYYHNGSGSPGSTLHTPNAQFRIMRRGAPPGAMTISVSRDTAGRCNWTGGNDVVIGDTAGGFYGTLDVATSLSFVIPAGDFVLDERYGQNIWVWNRNLRAAANQGTSVHCRIAVGAWDASAAVVIQEDASPTTPYGEPFQKYNQANAGTGGGSKRVLGPGFSPFPVALYADIDSVALEYTLPFKMHCDIRTAQSIRIRYYDPDTFSAGDPAGVSQPNGAMGVAVYNENNGALVYDNPSLPELNDMYGEFGFVAQPDTVYSIVWYNVWARNGIQFWMPFSEMPAANGVTCPPNNQPPIGTINANCTAAGVLTISASGTDPDGNALSYSMSSNGPGVSAMGSAGPHTFNPPRNGVTYTVTGTVSDGIAPPQTMTSDTYSCPAPSCAISAIGPVSDPAIYPGSRIRFNIATSNASGWTFRTAASNYAGGGRTANYTNNANVTVNTYANGAIITAPTTAPGPYNFNWELVLAGSPTVSCPATVTTTAPPAIPECTMAIVILNSSFSFVQPGGQIRIDYTVRNAQTAVFGQSFSSANWPFTADPDNIAGAGSAFTNSTYGTLGPNQTYSSLASGTSRTFTVNAPSNNYEIVSYLRNGATYIPCNNNVPTNTVPPNCLPADPDCCPVGSPFCTSTPVTRAPYIRAYGGDVVAGSGIEIGGACPTNNSAAISTFVDYRSSAPVGITGSGTQMAAYALGTIGGFRTNTQNTNARPQARAFANIPPNIRPTTNYGAGLTTTETFGGSYGGGLCASEWGAAPSDATVIAGANFDMTNQVGTFTRTGDLNLSTSGAITGKKTIFVTGNVYITGGANMVYDTTWASVDDVTSVVVVATGNILISPTVRNLDGFYVSGGTIYTCYNPASPGVLNITNVTTNGPCLNAQLTVNGALLAPNLRLWRLGGTIGQSTPVEDYGLSSGRTGETIRLSSEFLFADQSTESQNGSEGGLDRTYDAITSLPPTF